VKCRFLFGLFPLVAVISNGHAQSSETGRVTVTATPAPTPTEVSGTETTNTKPGFAPLSVMTGRAGDWMISYQFMFDRMDGNLRGTDEVSTREILRSFAFAPTGMIMEMHMFTVMYSPTERLNFTVMLPYLVKDMDMRARDGSQFTEHSDGIGDVGLLATYTVWQTNDLRHRVLIKGGNEIPTGSPITKNPSSAFGDRKKGWPYAISKACKNTAKIKMATKTNTSPTNERCR
jgi:hypothetical protein